MLDLVLSPTVWFSDGFTHAVDMLSGETRVPAPILRARLRAMQEAPVAFEPSDMSLLRDRLVRFSHTAPEDRSHVLNLIRTYLDDGGALAIMPTEKCNFRCTYCYEDFRKGRMSRPVADAVKAAITDCMARLRRFSLSWFGGEPLMNFPLLHEISAHARTEEARTGCALALSVTTNGYLMDEKVVRAFGALRVEAIQVTLDGPPEVHNLQRRHVKGSLHTYDRIFQNISQLLDKTDCRLILRCNYIPNAQVKEYLKDWVMGDIARLITAHGDRISFAAVPVWDATTTSVDGICLESLHAFQSWLAVERLCADARGLTTLESVARGISGIGTLACYAGKPNNYVIGADGAVYKCTVAFDLPENRVGYLANDGTLVLNSEREARWVQDNALTDPTCGGCPAAASCMGIHCPLTRIQTGRQPCPTFKRFPWHDIASSVGD